MEVLDNPSQNVMTQDEKTWSIVAHLSALIYAIGGFFAFLCPLILMLSYKDTSEVIYQQAKEALNFQISLLIIQIIAGLLFITIIGIPFSIAIWAIMGICSWLFPIIAAIRLSNGERYRYPYTIRIL